MRYLKRNGAGLAEYRGPAMGVTWYAANGWIGYAGALPLSRLAIEAGEVVELPEPELTEEWVSKERFIGALYALIPAESVAALLTEPEALKSSIAGLALLSSDAAPGGMIDLLDPRVTGFLSGFGLTVEAVRAEMGV